MCSTERYRWFAAVGFPIRTSSDQSLYTAPRGFSQCPTSFFGIWRLGIHHKPFLASLRDAENSILLSSSFFFFYVCSTLYSFVKVHQLTAIHLLCSKSCGGLLRLPSLDLTSFRKRFQRLTADRCLSSISFRNTCWLSTRRSCCLVLQTAARHMPGRELAIQQCLLSGLSEQAVVLSQTFWTFLFLAQVEMRGFEPLASAVQRRRSPI